MNRKFAGQPPVMDPKPTTLSEERPSLASPVQEKSTNQTASTPRPLGKGDSPLAGESMQLSRSLSDRSPVPPSREAPPAPNEERSIFRSLVNSTQDAPRTFAAGQPRSTRPVSPLSKTAAAGVPATPTPSLFNRPLLNSPFAGGEYDLKVTPEEFIQLRDFLYQQSGIYITENRKYLVENRLASRLRSLGLHSFGEYYNYLKYDVNRARELNTFFEHMTTNETSFFRNGPQLDVFRDKVLSDLLTSLRAQGQRRLRIWSAGCSSGEEAYTLAIILYEVLKQEIRDWDIKITANDLSPAMLTAARAGLYNDYALRTTPQDMLNKYFAKEGNLYRIDPRLATLINFSQINLSDSTQLKRVERSQIIFCRNVIIYFDDEMKRNVISAFYDNLLPGGYLLIGHSESLHNLSRAFKPEHHAGSIVYRKQS